MKEESLPAFTRNWTRRKALAAGGLALLGLAGCGGQVAQNPPRVSGGTALSQSDLQPTLAVPVATPITVGFTGDVMFGRTVNTHMLSTALNDPFPFTSTAGVLRGFDITIGNLECVISKLGSPIPNKPYTFRGDPRAYDRLLNAGFDIVSVSNNHSGDYGPEAFVDELLTLPKSGLVFVGGGHNKHEAHQPVFKTVRGTTIGLLAYEEIIPTSFAATDTTPGNAWLTATDLQADLAAARPTCDFLIAFMHWGIEYVTSEDSQQRSQAQVAIDAGADLVVGAHPHVIQPYEFYKNKLIVYSLGNFVFDNMLDEVVRRGNILSLTIQKNQLLSWKLIPTRIGDWGEPNLLSS